MSNKILDIKNLSFRYKNPNNDEWKTVFENINFSINKGSVIGIAGESGCGKTTLAKAIVNYHILSGARKNKDYQIDGDVVFYKDSNPYSIFNKSYYKKFSPPPIQMVFQDPRTSLNMKMKLYDQLKESVKLNSNIPPHEVENEIMRISENYKIEDQVKRNATPENLSGGQRRRFGLAKIISSNPEIIIADEPVSALDVSIQAQVINLMMDLQEEFNLTILFIAHDLSVVKHISEEVAVMYLGELVEFNTIDSIFNNPQHSYTKSLLNAIPIPNPNGREDRKQKRKKNL